MKTQVKLSLKKWGDKMEKHLFITSNYHRFNCYLFYFINNLLKKTSKHFSTAGLNFIYYFYAAQ